MQKESSYSQSDSDHLQNHWGPWTSLGFFCFGLPVLIVFGGGFWWAAIWMCIQIARQMRGE